MLTYADFVHQKLFKERDSECGDMLEVRVVAADFKPFSSRLIMSAITSFLDAFGILPQEVVFNDEVQKIYGKTQMDVYLLRNDGDAQDIYEHYTPGAGDVIGISLRTLGNALDVPTIIAYRGDDGIACNAAGARYTVPLCEICQLQADFYSVTEQLAQCQDEAERQRLDAQQHVLLQRLEHEAQLQERERQRAAEHDDEAQA